MPIFFPNTWNGDASTVTATSQQFAAVLAAGETHRFSSSTACWIQQGYNPTATAADSAPLVVADDIAASATDVNATTDAITLTTHGLLTGDGPLQVTTSNALPGGLALLTNYWVVKVDANIIKLATSLYNAMYGTTLDITSTGTGNQTFSDTVNTRRAGSMFVAAGSEVFINGGGGVTLAVLRDAADGKASLTRGRVG